MKITGKIFASVLIGLALSGTALWAEAENVADRSTRVIKAFDISGDQALDEAELVAAVEGMLAKRGQRENSKNKEFVVTMTPIPTDLAIDVIASFDVDGSSTIDSSELKQSLPLLRKHNLGWNRAPELQETS